MALPAQPNRSLIDGLDVLQAVAAAPGPVGVRELGRMLDMETTRANRLLKTLAGIGITQQREDRRYEPGPGLHVIAAQALYGSGLLRRSIAPLRKLQALGHTVALGVRWRDRVSYLIHAGPKMDVAEGIGRSTLFPADRSSIGLVLLASEPAKIVRQLYGNDAPGLLEQLQAVRHQGYARVVNQQRPLTATVGVRVGTPAVAGVAVSGHITTRDVPGVLPALREAAKQIERGAQP